MATRLNVLKTYKIYIGGKFPRTESGRYYPLEKDGKTIANVCLGSRKDFRNAVVAARSAQGGWEGKSAFNRSQIIYRIAEILEGRSDQFVAEMLSMGISKANAQKEVETSIDRLVYYAGWCDKYQQVFSSVNPVASSHFNFSAYEAQGVIAVICDEGSALLGLVNSIIPSIVGGNTVVAIASKSLPLCAISFAEVLATSDVPGGVINIITGDESELISHIGKHMDVNGIVYCRENLPLELEKNCTNNMKRLSHSYFKNVSDDKAESPYAILDNLEVKTTWHPIEQIGGASSGY